MQTKFTIIETELLQKITSYLAKKPWDEVDKLIQPVLEQASFENQNRMRVNLTGQPTLRKVDQEKGSTPSS